MNRFQNPRVWDYIAVNAKNIIEAGGWYNSFDGKAFSKAEMEQYVENTYEKLKPYVSKEKKAIEIGCASGLTMFRIAPYVEKYIGTDMAEENLKKNAKRIHTEGITNISLLQCAANEIGVKIFDKMDIIIINSVCQYFPDMEYFESVMRQSIEILKPNGILYLGDILDLDLLDSFKKELIEYQVANPDKKVKIDRSDELWIGRSYFNNITILGNQVKKVTISDKIAAIKNELTKYRYDVVIQV